MIHFTRHACDRAWERYGLIPTAQDWTRAAGDIIEVVAGSGCNAVLLSRQDMAERWLVRIAGVPVLAIWSPDLAQFVTLLTPP